MIDGEICVGWGRGEGWAEGTARKNMQKLFLSPTSSAVFPMVPEQPSLYKGSKEGSRMPMLITEKANRSHVDGIDLLKP